MITYIKNLFNQLIKKFEDQKKRIFENFIEIMAPNIVINWCMTKYYDYLINIENNFKSVNKCKNQADMLAFYLKIVAKRELKHCNKKKLVKKVYVKKLHLNEPYEVANIIRSVFINEGAEEYINKISNQCANSYKDIIYMMTHDCEDIYKNVQNKFNIES